ncbi:MAG TPA: oligosaccharide flippase family protein [Bacteroidales bacterium]|nr:oligosaccharide flippase family protein [Bacteroidales bacterium]MDD4395179.1 oligosaccharide flippase family protein [Bacteroidales bacterium]HNW67927.1 oligosaccharide flippase family protein [Bacteroidales bacterium]HPT52253.1 oligosaccharide flippase family protein [Bacteroidales bacterium]
MKQKDFIFNIALLIFLNLLIKPFWILGIDVAVQNRVGAENYGLYFAIFNFTYIFNAILDMGITNFNNRNIARHTSLLTKHLSGIISLKLLLGVAYLLITFGVALTIGYDSLHLKLLFWMAINQFFNTFILYLRSNISALLMFKTDSFLSILDRLLMILFCGVLLWSNWLKSPFKIEYFVYTQTIAYFISALIALFVVIKKSHLRKLNWNPAFFVLILKKSFPFALLYLLMSFYNRIDSVMIERILPGEISTMQAGVYASAFRLLDALVMISYLFSVILLPLFSKMLKDKDDLSSIIRSSFALLFFFSVTAVVLLLNYRIPILELLYNEHIAESAAVFSFLIPCLIPISFTYIFGTLLTANGNMRLLNWSAVVGIVINLIVNFILIPRLYAQGAAIASLATQSMMAVIQTVIAFRILKIPLSNIPLLRSILFAAILIIGTHYFAIYFHGNLIISLSICALFACITAFCTKLISFNFWKEFSRK